MRPFHVLLVAATFACMIAGCGRSGPPRYEVSGQVIFDGAPIEEGVITFLPQEGQGSMDASVIKKGAYRIPKDKGLYAGKYKVSINAADGFSGPGDAGATPRERKGGANRGTESIPPEWNVETQKTVEVKAEGPNQFDFNIPKG